MTSRCTRRTGACCRRRKDRRAEAVVKTGVRGSLPVRENVEDVLSEKDIPPAGLWRRGGNCHLAESYFDAFYCGATSTLMRWGLAASTLGTSTVSTPCSYVALMFSGATVAGS